MEKPLVSIIVITYNSSKYILETLESAKKQTYQNIELIISDDCSTDNTVNICRQWINLNKNRFVNTELITVEKNNGIAANCNRGIYTAKGEWIKLIAGDDILLPNCITTNINIINNNDILFAASKFEYIDENSKYINYCNQKSDVFIDYFSKLDFKKQLKVYSRYPEFLNTPTFFINRNFIKSINGFDESYKIHEDTPLIFNIIKAGHKISIFNNITVKYRISNASISRTKNTIINDKRTQEQLKCFYHYRKNNLNVFNIIDLSVYFEIWLFYKFKGIKGHKFSRILILISLNYWYKKMILNRIIK